MSAFDIAGAVVASPLAVLFFACALNREDHKPGDREVRQSCFWVSVVFMLWAAFCIARLNGASL